VCGPWRQVAKTTNALWTRIEYTLGQDIEKVRQWLERSGDNDIDIDINDANTRSWTIELEVEIMNAVMVLLAPHVHRWTSFMLYVSRKRLMELTLHSYLYAAPGAPHLRTLSLSYTTKPPPETLFEPESIDSLGPLFGGHTPLLKSVCLCGVHIKWTSDPILKELDHLRFANHEVDGHLPWEVFSQILKKSPRLRSLEIANSGPTENGHRWPDDRIVLSDLENLSLTAIDPQYCHSILDRMIMPSLRELELYFDDGNPRELLTQRFIDPNRNILNNLTALKLVHIGFAVPEIAILYRNLSNLVKLNLNLEYLPDTFLQAMHELDPIPLPQLRVLVVVGSTFWIEPLRLTISERKRKGYPIQKLMIASQDTVTGFAEVWFRSEVEEFERFEATVDDNINKNQ